jgi:hypothetical protein
MQPIDQPADAGAARPTGLRSDFPIDRLRAVIFDMDGVITDTAAVHRAAWKELFDAFLPGTTDASARPTATSAPVRRGRLPPLRGRQAPWQGPRLPRLEGIRLPEGDPPTARPGHGRGLGCARTRSSSSWWPVRGVAASRTLGFIDRLTAAGARGRHLGQRERHQILTAAGVLHRFDVKVDGVDSRRLRLPGKPDPAIFLEAARRLASRPEPAPSSRTPWLAWRPVSGAASPSSWPWTGRAIAPSCSPLARHS